MQFVSFNHLTDRYFWNYQRSRTELEVGVNTQLIEFEVGSFSQTRGLLGIVEWNTGEQIPDCGNTLSTEYWAERRDAEGKGGSGSTFGFGCDVVCCVLCVGWCVLCDVWRPTSVWPVDWSWQKAFFFSSPESSRPIEAPELVKYTSWKWKKEEGRRSSTIAHYQFLKDRRNSGIW